MTDAVKAEKEMNGKIIPGATEPLYVVMGVKKEDRRKALERTMQRQSLYI